jgi:hypothetical protein
MLDGLARLRVVQILAVAHESIQNEGRRIALDLPRAETLPHWHRLGQAALVESATSL